MSHSKIYTKRYASGCQRDPAWRAKHRIVANPRANFHYPRASIKARERSEFKAPIVRRALERAMRLAGPLKPK